jgi:hypothetical protein
VTPESAWTAAQRATLDAVNDRAEWHDADGEGFDWIAMEDATGDPVIYVYDEHDDFVLRPDGTLERPPTPNEPV